MTVQVINKYKEIWGLESDNIKQSLLVASLLAVLTPRNIFLDESKPAAKILAVYGGFLSQTILQANREMVLWVIWVSSLF